MKSCPAIGARVTVEATPWLGAYTGTVTKIYRTYVYDDVGDHDSDVLEPECDWHVCVIVDAIPSPWPYSGREIAPAVNKLALAPAVREIEPGVYEFPKAA